MSIGELHNKWVIHRQFNGVAKPKIQLSIDDIIPFESQFKKHKIEKRKK